MAPLNATAHGFNTAVLQRRPSVSSPARIGVVEEESVLSGHFTDIFTECQNLGNITLATHDTAGAEGIAHALVDAVFQRNIDVELECVEPADPARIQRVVGAFEGAARNKRTQL